MYRVLVGRRVQRALTRIPEADYRRIAVAIRALAADPRPQGSIKLAGRDAWRIRGGDYRVIYEIDDGAGIVRVVQRAAMSNSIDVVPHDAGGSEHLAAATRRPAYMHA